MEFSLKPINFFGREFPVICQNENGPCPLIAIANVLLLQDKIFISVDRSLISLSELTQIVANAILEKIGGSTLPDHIKLVESVLNILPKLANGLDLNVIFSGVNKFEFTEEISVFDALGIQLLHGWIYDSDDTVTASVIGNQSYNHLIFRLVEYKSLSTKSAECGKENEKTNGSEEHAQLCYEAGVIETFLNKTAQQFTYTGMLALYNTLHDRQFAVFFRNNHFSTLFFHQGQLFSLITDLGYRYESAVVWEILNDVDGNSDFFDSRFEPLAVERAVINEYLQQGSGGEYKPPVLGGTIAAPPATITASARPNIASAPPPPPPPPPATAVQASTIAISVAGAAGSVDDGAACADKNAEEAIATVTDLVPSGIADFEGVKHNVEEGEGEGEEAYEMVSLTEAADDTHGGSEGSAEEGECIAMGMLVVEGVAAAEGDHEQEQEQHHEQEQGQEEESSEECAVDATVTEPMRLSQLEASVEEEGAGAQNTLSMHSGHPSSFDADLALAMQLQLQEEEEQLLAEKAQSEYSGSADDSERAMAAYMTSGSATSSASTHRPKAGSTPQQQQPHHRTQEEADRELALELHNQEIRADEQRRAREAAAATASAGPSRTHTTLAGSTSSAFPYNRSEERPRPKKTVKKDGCVVC